MRRLTVACNPVTGRCHVVPPTGLALKMGYPSVEVSRVPDAVSPAALCMALEKNDGAWKRGRISYRELIPTRRKTNAKSGRPRKRGGEVCRSRNAA